RERWCVSALVATALMSGSAEAADKNSCITAANEGQDGRAAGKLVLAHDRFVACSRAECPAIIRKSCAGWLDEVNASLPTIVLGARDSRGQDVLDVRVFLDDTRLAEKLDGTGVSLDPGSHRLRFERESSPPVEIDLVAREGEKNRPVIA